MIAAPILHWGYSYLNDGLGPGIRNDCLYILYLYIYIYICTYIYDYVYTHITVLCIHTYPLSTMMTTRVVTSRRTTLLCSCPLHVQPGQSLC